MLAKLGVIYTGGKSLIPAFKFRQILYKHEIFTLPNKDGVES